MVAFCPISKSLVHKHVDNFEVPAPNDGYDLSREAILAHVKALLDQLASRRK